MKIIRLLFVKKLLHGTLKFIICMYIILFCVAFFMKDYANNDWVRLICKEYVNGPKNMLALVVDKASPGAMKIDSVLVPPPKPAQELPEHEKAVKAVLERYQKQAAIDEKLRAEYESGEYSLDDPLVVVNPYGISPLTALVMFDTDEEMQEAVRIIGHNANEDILMSPPEWTV